VVRCNRLKSDGETFFTRMPPTSNVVQLFITSEVVRVGRGLTSCTGAAVEEGWAGSDSFVEGAGSESGFPIRFGSVIGIAALAEFRVAIADARAR